MWLIGGADRRGLPSWHIGAAARRWLDGAGRSALAASRFVG